MMWLREEPSPQSSQSVVPPFWTHSAIEGFVGFTISLNARSVRPMRLSARKRCFVP